MIKIGGKVFKVGLLILIILFTLILCASASMNVDDNSGETHHVAERRAKEGLLWISGIGFFGTICCMLWILIKQPNDENDDDF